MKLLHILKTTPDDMTKTLMDIISEKNDTSVFNLYREDADYENLVDMIFEHDRVISWW